MGAQEFNNKFPVGTRVKYHPVICQAEAKETRTRSEAWELGHGEPVVLVEGKTGGVSLRAITVLD